MYQTGPKDLFGTCTCVHLLAPSFDSDFAILEDAGRNKFSMADKFKKINTAQQKCGNQYATIFTMIESAGTLDDTFNYKKGCQLLIGHYNRHFDPTHDKLLEGLSGGAPTPVAALLMSLLLDRHTLMTCSTMQPSRGDGAHDERFV